MLFLQTFKQLVKDYLLSKFIEKNASAHPLIP